MSTPGSSTDPCRQDDPVCTAANGKAYATCMDGKWADKCQCVVMGQLPSTSNPPVQTGAGARCGDGMISGSEACDGTNLNNSTCQSIGYAGGGMLSCNQTTCNFDVFMCRMTTGGGAGASGGAGTNGGGAGRSG